MLFQQLPSQKVKYLYCSSFIPIFNITDKWEQSVLIVDEANDISYCVGNKGKNHAARFRSPNGLVIIPALPKFSDTLTLSQSGGAEKFFVITPL